MFGASNRNRGDCMPVTALKNFLRLESSAGYLLLRRSLGTKRARNGNTTKES